MPVRVIKGQSALVNWFAKELIRFGPQVEVSGNFLMLFRTLVSDLRWFSEIRVPEYPHHGIATIVGACMAPVPSARANEGLQYFVEAILEEILLAEEPISLEEFVERACAALRLSNLVFVSRDGENLYITSEPQLEKRHNVRIRVTIRDY